MAATSRAHARKPVQTTGRSWAAARSAGDLRRRAIAAWRSFVPWWSAQADHRRLAMAVVGFVALISVLDLAGAGRVGASQAVPPTATAVAATTRFLRAESAPTIPDKAWFATQLWQGSGSRVTEPFTVGAHWRVDWLFDPPQSGGILQVFIYSADGARLMDVAANSQQSGADTSFWAGPGTYFLKVNSTGGDWKLDVQDLR
ncbi:MAG TPA: hypothetical protein VIN69_09680 [Candidatus Limnocylindria bacterium]|jgi:hypothetical protein